MSTDHRRRSPAHPRRLAAALAAAVALLAAGLVWPAGPAAAAGDPGEFYDGQISYSTILNCISIIQGNPYPEYGAGAYVGIYSDPDESPPIPSVNQTVYMHVVVYGLGNACSGQRFIPAFILPSGMSFDTNYPILCFTQSGQATGSGDCPQWGNVGNAGFHAGAQAYFSTDAANANTWPLPQGAFWEFRFPVKSTTVQTSATLRGYVKMFDGDDNPVLPPTSLVYVFGGAGQPSVLYDTPSTYAAPADPLDNPTTYGILSEAVIVTHGAAGYILLQRTNAGGAWDADTLQIYVDGSATSWRLWTDWNESHFDPLAANTDYQWRVGFDPGALGASGGSAVWGANQAFRSLASPTCLGQAVTVGLQFGQLPTAGDDVIMGTSGVDNIDGDAGNDRICALGGNDTLIGGAGNDRLDGGGGGDTASYAGTAAGVTVRLTTTAAQATGGAGSDTLTGIEHLAGGAGPDVLTGNGAANTLSGSAGGDALNGGGGGDALDGGAGTDTLAGGAGNDRTTGGPGQDTASYKASTAAVTVSLAVSTQQATGGAGKDTVKGVEHLTGGDGDDDLTGNRGDNVLDGRGGRDRCAGGAGTDSGPRCEIKTGIP